jgi:hexosaminidase
LATGTYAIPAHLQVIVSDEFQEATQLLTEHPAIKSLAVEVLKKNKKGLKKAFALLKLSMQII